MPRKWTAALAEAEARATAARPSRSASAKERISLTAVLGRLVESSSSDGSHEADRWAANGIASKRVRTSRSRCCIDTCGLAGCVRSQFRTTTRRRRHASRCASASCGHDDIASAEGGASASSVVLPGAACLCSRDRRARSRSSALSRVHPPTRGFSRQDSPDSQDRTGPGRCKTHLNCISRRSTARTRERPEPQRHPAASRAHTARTPHTTHTGHRMCRSTPHRTPARDPHTPHTRRHTRGHTRPRGGALPLC